MQRWCRDDAEEVQWCRCRGGGGGAEVVQRWCRGAEVQVQRWCRGGGAKVGAKHQVVHVVQRRWCKGGVVVVQSAGAEVVQMWCRGGGAPEVLLQGCRYRGGAEVVQRWCRGSAELVQRCSSAGVV